jgi:DNA-binding transcriptional LysR family regulator
MVRREIKLLESAIAVAEELNFSRAARKVRLSQPTVTRNISIIEGDLGTELFERNRKRVILTDAGRAFVEEARISILHRRRAFEVARAVAQNAESVLNIGKSPYADPFLMSILLAVRLPLYPQLKVELSSQFSFDLAHEVLAGELDLAIATEPPESRQLTAIKIDESPFYIAMSKKDILAGESSVTLDSLAGRMWVMPEHWTHPLVDNAIMKLAEAHKVRPAKVQHIVLPEEAFPYIVDGAAVAFVVKSGALHIAHNGVTVRPLDEKALVLKTCLVSQAENRSKVLSELVRGFMRKLPSLNKAQSAPLHALA